MSKEQLSPDLLKTRQHFEVLDGLRGVAALAIVIFHFMEWVYPDYKQNFIGHGFLAVDFFFCLSGFVIAYAYDNRLEKMGIGSFFKSRLIRLHPLVIFGSALGLLCFLFDPFVDQASAYSVGKIALLFLCSILLIPLPIMEERAFNLFGFNAPAWSLFWEYVANIVYALILHRINRRYLSPVLIVAGLGLVYTSYRAGNLLGGWAGSNFWDGGVRVAYSFLAGLIIYRFNLIIKNRLGFIVLALLLSLAFAMPSSSRNWLTEALVVLLYFPLLVALGAGTILAPSLQKLCQFSGNLSYPLYMTHYAAIWIFGNYYTNRKPGMSEVSWVVIVGVILLVLFAYLVMKLYDTPVRKYLNERRKKKLMR